MKKILCSLIIVLLTSVCFIGLSKAQIPVGVKVGDEFVYEIAGFLIPLAGNLPEDHHNSELWSDFGTIFLLDLNQMDFMRVKITDIYWDQSHQSVKSVGLSLNHHFRNGTEIETEWLNYFRIDYGNCLVFPANLTSGSRLYPSAEFVVSTEIRQYLNSERETNHAYLTQDYIAWDNNLQKNYVAGVYYSDIYFDKNTGVLVAGTFGLKRYVGPDSTVISYECKETYSLKQSSLWTVSDYSAPTPSNLGTNSLMDYSYAIIAVLAVSVVVGIGLVIRKRKHQRLPLPPPPPQ
jgi:hypothetical protein